ncbi:MAG: EAL domain-containing protein [Methylovulum sp.]|nr:MAG: EAL domain-containing protein [Methylovulum sp.]
MKNSAKERMIIIAENNPDIVQNIAHCLSDNGFSDLRIVHNGNSVYETLRPYYRQPEAVGILIISEHLPECQIVDMCKTLACGQDAYIVPMIILGSRQKQRLECELGALFGRVQAGGLIHYLELPLNNAELLTAINFQLAIKQERCLRYMNKELLMSELAERKVVDAKLKYLIAHDELTGLLNRQNFERHLWIILKRNKKLPQNGALLYIDIDRFSLINELEGYEVGDRLIVEVVAAIRTLVNKTYCFTRIGSDEFCLYLDNQNAGEAQQFAEKIRRELDDFRFFVDDVVYNSTVSIGVASLHSDKAVYHPSDLISRARQACRMAKENGRNMVWEYNDRDSGVLERQHDVYWAPLIRSSLIESNFFLLFQPVIELHSERISHYEVLLRMQGKDDDEAIGPAVFIPVAERMGLIHSVDLWVVENAIDYLAALPDFMAHVSLAVNLSSVAFQDTSLLSVIKAKLDMTWVEPSRLMFEITETAAVDNFEQTRNMILKIRALGCKFALDDFGAGFCSFNYLKKFPVDYIKIDGQFIQNLINDETDQVLVRSIVEIATKLGKKTIAEFVESPEVVTKLQEMGVDLAQGYIFGKPEKTLKVSNVISIYRLMLNAQADNESCVDPFIK